MKNEQRDRYVCQDYPDGKEIHELARSHGLSEGRVSQILKKNKITRRPRNTVELHALSAYYTQIGLHLYHYRYEHGIDLWTVVADFRWSGITIRKVEKGTKPHRAAGPAGHCCLN